MNSTARETINKRIVIRQFGGPEVLQIEETPLELPPRGHIRMRVEAAGVCALDTAERRGMSHPGLKLTLPWIPGIEVVGVIDAVGDGIDMLQVGIRVAAILETGGYTSFVNVEAWRCFRVPEGVDPAQAVALLVNYWTAYHALFTLAHVKHGSRVLVTGGSGGVGTAALDLGRWAGATLYATVSAQKQETVRAFGATPIDYKTEDFVTSIRQLTGDGVDAVVEVINGEHAVRAFSTLRRGGSILMVGASAATGNLFVGSVLPLIKLLPRLVFNRITNQGRILQLVLMDTKRLRNSYTTVIPQLLTLLAEGKLTPVIGTQFALADAAKAHETLESGKSVGKLVLIP